MIQVKGPWSPIRLRRWLDATIVPLRLAVNGASGTPINVSLWFLREEDALWCATRPKARIAERLAADPRCAFEVSPDAPPYRGVRGQGSATLVPERGGEILESLIQRYLGTAESDFTSWLRKNKSDEVAIRIEPARLTSWDFTERMTGRKPGGPIRQI